ncbi:MAG: hypothetical protein F6J93_24580 [Oscillatoria sp. SIO1A7]|nr:hypothetical protein [Oscillatoria sp. SIO1A7]
MAVKSVRAYTDRDRPVIYESTSALNANPLSSILANEKLLEHRLGNQSYNGCFGSGP